MNSRLGRIIATSTALLLTITPLARAETPTRSIRESGVLPYLLDNPHNNSLVQVRCVPRFRQEVNRERSMIRDSLLRPNVSDRYDTVTIEIAGSCRHVKIRVQNDSDYSDYPVYNPYSDQHHREFGDDWLTREGSGWHWLLRNKQ
ncbi:hypothetical protein [Anabaena subtropica]|uniref:Uncharacterized protein n=1 Tax=Anabaena subtropica FACHB-260 TaxID=2692884 RepID=A0ABR8CQU5_9NOST|nr:hypothetical protein [Anabaena subtropica]MBD2345562.1 hypothetical protein [Anabaena subtropica FACHB-260]